MRPSKVSFEGVSMALGKQRAKQQDFWIATQDLPRSPGHPFYDRLNKVLEAAGFDEYVENLCAAYYAENRGRPSIPPGVYFRMLFIGYFEGIDSQRGIAWRCSDSLALRDFLRLRPGDRSPDHSSLTVIRKRLPLAVHEQVFTKVLEIAREQGLLKGKKLAVDATTLEANAAMKSIVRKKTGEDWRKYVERLAKEAGIENPTDEDLRKFDKKRKGKKVSNKDWMSPADPDARITRMKNGDTHLAYKSEHGVDLETELVLAATIHPADRSDSESLPETVVQAQLNTMEAGSEESIQDVVTDKGYHKTERLAELESWGVRTYIAERKSKTRRRWTDKPEGWREAFYGNRRRCRGARGKKLQRLRSERVERSFAHVCETGGARRSWIRGLPEVTKRYLMQVAGHNLGVIMRNLFGVGSPRALQGLSSVSATLFRALRLAQMAVTHLVKASYQVIARSRPIPLQQRDVHVSMPYSMIAA
jgi:transposase